MDAVDDEVGSWRELAGRAQCEQLPDRPAIGEEREPPAQRTGLLEPAGQEHGREPARRPFLARLRGAGTRRPARALGGAPVTVEPDHRPAERRDQATTLDESAALYGPRVATFALIHGGGSSAWDWHLVVRALRERGHEPTAVDLPIGDQSAGWWEYADVVADAVREQPRPLIIVGHSLGGFTAPLVCARIPVALLVLVAAMIPSPGERFDEWWTRAGYEDSGLDDVFYHDVPPALAAEAQRRERDEQSPALREPWPLDAWPPTPTRYLLCRDDRLFTAGWARRHARERLGVEADEMPGGHYVAISRPRELARRLDAYAAGLGDSGP